MVGVAATEVCNVIGKRPDVMVGLSKRQRQRQEQADRNIVLRLHTVLTRPKNRVIATWGNDLSTLPDPKKTPIRVIVCQRVDLDHPIESDTNVFGSCADCGCDIQFHPGTLKQIDHLCISCTARRIRERETAST
jgi:hypothetical protein